MASANFDLDLTLSVKQGQVEVDQAAVVTDYSDAQVVERSTIELHNAAIATRGNDKISGICGISEFIPTGCHILCYIYKFSHPTYSVARDKGLPQGHPRAPVGKPAPRS